MKQFLLLVLIFWSFGLQGQKREMRGAWVTTVFNRDWPTSKTLTSQAQRDQFVSTITQLKSLGFNAVFVQIRCSADAFYPSTLEPWSEWLTGTQGKAPSPIYDPLAFMIAEVQNRGMEFHAWINPFRAITSNTTSSIASNHISKTKPEWMLPYGNLTIINPGIKEARAYVNNVVMDIVRRYPIDGVHFDDYFYPYPQTGIVLTDTPNYEADKRGITTIQNWRRDNINIFVKEMRDSIKAFDKRIKFGISPFGIWRNARTDATGSQTTGLQSYDDIYADSKKWVQEGWIDYVVPQIYWPFGFTVADYNVLAQWWQSIVNKGQLYIGQGAYRTDPTLTTGWAAEELPKQLRYNRTNNGIHGSLFYSTKDILFNNKGIRDSMRSSIYILPAIIPAMPWVDNVAPLPPTNLIAQKSGNQVNLVWNRSDLASDGEYARRYVIYRFVANENIDLNKQERIIFITSKDVADFTDFNVTNNDQYQYVVTALDRTHNESIASNVATLLYTSNQELEIAQMIKVFPNPTYDAVTVSLPKDLADKVQKCYLFSISGELIETYTWRSITTTDSATGRLDLSNFKQGIYLFKTDASSTTIRILKH